MNCYVGPAEDLARESSIFERVPINTKGPIQPEQIMEMNVLISSNASSGKRLALLNYDFRNSFPTNCVRQL